MTMVNHSQFLHYVLFLVFKIGHTVSEAESVTIHTWNRGKALAFLTFRGPCIVIYSYNKPNETH